jgi:hypothetical protein
MHSIQEGLEEFRRQLRNGSVQRAYAALLAYMLRLRTHFKASHSDYRVSGLYQGYLDMTYFALFPPHLKSRDLKSPSSSTTRRSGSKPGSPAATDRCSGGIGSCSGTAVGLTTVWSRPRRALTRSSSATWPWIST